MPLETHPHGKRDQDTPQDTCLDSGSSGTYAPFSSLIGFGGRIVNSAATAGQAITGTVAATVSAGAAVASSAVELGSKQVLSTTAWLYETGTSLGTVTAQAAGEAFEELFLNTTSLAAKAGTTIDSGLEQLAGDPAQPQAVHIRGLRLAAGLLPIVGNAQGIAQARIKYRSAQSIQDPAECERIMQEARRDCLITSTALSLELATLGVSGALDKALKVGSAVMSVLSATKAIRETTEKSSSLPKINLDVLTSRAVLIPLLTNLPNCRATGTSMANLRGFPIGRACYVVSICSR